MNSKWICVISCVWPVSWQPCMAKALMHTLLNQISYLYHFISRVLTCRRSQNQRKANHFDVIFSNIFQLMRSRSIWCGFEVIQVRHCDITLLEQDFFWRRKEPLLYRLHQKTIKLKEAAFSCHPMFVQTCYDDEYYWNLLVGWVIIGVIRMKFDLVE